MEKGRRQKEEGRRKRAEGRRQKAEVRRNKIYFCFLFFTSCLPMLNFNLVYPPFPAHSPALHQLLDEIDGLAGRLSCTIRFWGT
jgi:hypothetical protein